MPEVSRAHAEGLLENLDRSKSTRGRVERLRIPALPTGHTNMDTIAVDCSPRRLAQSVEHHLHTVEVAATSVRFANELRAAERVGPLNPTYRW